MRGTNPNGCLTSTLCFFLFFQNVQIWLKQLCQSGFVEFLWMRLSWNGKPAWGSCRSPPLRRPRLFWKKEWISAFSTEVVRSSESSERALSSQRALEKVNATTGVCCRCDRKCSSVSHTFRSWEAEKTGRRRRVRRLWGKRTGLGGNRGGMRSYYLAGGGDLGGSVPGAEWLVVFAGALFLGIDGGVVPETQTSLMRTTALVNHVLPSKTLRYFLDKGVMQQNYWGKSGNYTVITSLLRLN